MLDGTGLAIRSLPDGSALGVLMMVWLRGSSCDFGGGPCLSVEAEGEYFSASRVKVSASWNHDGGAQTDLGIVVVMEVAR